MEGEGRDDHFGKLGLDLEAVADGVDACDASLLEEEDGGGADEDAVERAGDFIEDGDGAYGDGGEDDDEQGAYGYDEVPGVEGADVLGVAYPFADEVAGGLEGYGDELACLACDLLGEAEDVGDLCGEDGDGDACGEAYDDGVGDELDDGAELEHSETYEYDACHHGGYEEALESVGGVGDDAVDDDNEGACGAANLYFSASEE